MHAVAIEQLEAVTLCIALPDKNGDTDAINVTTVALGEPLDDDVALLRAVAVDCTDSEGATEAVERPVATVTVPVDEIEMDTLTLDVVLTLARPVTTVAVTDGVSDDITDALKTALGDDSKLALAAPEGDSDSVVDRVAVRDTLEHTLAVAHML